MSMKRYAHATIVVPHIDEAQWTHVRTAGTDKKAVSLPSNLMERAAMIFGRPFNPKDFLLSHATIVSSVDTYIPKGTEVGGISFDGFKVVRKYPDYRITPGTEKFINQNHDAWERKTLLKAYPTFIGGQNFCEHVAMEELSKGRILDAVARDIGDSVYVDILLATERKHEDLISAIENRQLFTLSMGCSIDESTCTKCGHVAATEETMCSHVRYQKGSSFIDDNGRPAIIAELCGHSSIEPHGGVYFTEASWVSSPAFKGAVVRNTLNSEAISDTEAQTEALLNEIPWDLGGKKLIFASKTAEVPSPHQTPVQEPHGQPTEQQTETEAPEIPPEAAPQENLVPEPPHEEKKDPLKQLSDDAYQELLKQVKKDFQESLTKNNGSVLSQDSSFMRQAKIASGREAIAALVSSAGSDIEAIEAVAQFHNKIGVKVPVSLYRALVRIGGTHMYPNIEEFIDAARTMVGRDISKTEQSILIKLGTLLAKRED